MAVCTTCLQPGLTPGKNHDCPGRPRYEDIAFTRHQGQAITIDGPAPAHTRIQLQALMDRYAYLHMPDPQTIVFADQVVYRITGYSEGALELELAEDWRPGADSEPQCAVCLTPLSQHEGRICERPAAVVAEEKPPTDELKTRWKEQHGKVQAVHPVTVLNEESK
ncbi:hypothetical protein ACFZCU_46005 [Streptomyces canus]|uniref:hypothetical protein n=1 Tax=Streptomyces canus TaxID=58343 RepID=UPI0036E32876